MPDTQCFPCNRLASEEPCDVLWIPACLLQSVSIVMFVAILLIPVRWGADDSAMVWFKPNAAGGISYHYGPLGSCVVAGGTPYCTKVVKFGFPIWDSIGQDGYIQGMMKPDITISIVVVLITVGVTVTGGLCLLYAIVACIRIWDFSQINWFNIGKRGSWGARAVAFLNIIYWVILLCTTILLRSWFKKTVSDVRLLVYPPRDVSVVGQYNFEVLEGKSATYVWIGFWVQTGVTIFVVFIGFDWKICLPKKREAPAPAAEAEKKV